MTKSILLKTLLLVSLAGLLLPVPGLLARTSDTPTVLGRYALDYSGFLVFYAVMLAAWVGVSAWGLRGDLAQRLERTGQALARRRWLAVVLGLGVAAGLGVYYAAVLSTSVGAVDGVLLAPVGAVVTLATAALPCRPTGLFGAPVRRPLLLLLAALLLGVWYVASVRTAFTSTVDYAMRVTVVAVYAVWFAWLISAAAREPQAAPARPQPVRLPALPYAAAMLGVAGLSFYALGARIGALSAAPELIALVYLAIGAYAAGFAGPLDLSNRARSVPYLGLYRPLAVRLLALVAFLVVSSLSMQVISSTPLDGLMAITSLHTAMMGVVAVLLAWALGGSFEGDVLALSQPGGGRVRRLGFALAAAALLLGYWYLLYTAVIPAAPGALLIPLTLLLAVLPVAAPAEPAEPMVWGGAQARWAAVAAALAFWVLWLAVWLLPWQPLLGGWLFGRVLVASLAFALPGFALTRLLAPRDDFGTLNALAIGLTLSITVVGLLGLGARTLGLPFRWLYDAFFVVGGVLVTAALARAGASGTFELPALPWASLPALLPALAVGLIVVSTTFEPIWNPDKFTYSAFLVNWQAAPVLNLREVFVGQGTPLSARFWLMYSPLVEAVLAQVSGVHGLLLIVSLLKPVLAVLALAAVYGLARAVGLNRDYALIAVSAQVAVLFLLSTSTFRQAGWTFFMRLTEDKGLAAFLVAPVVLQALVRLLREPRLRHFWLLMLAGLALMFTHPTILGITYIIAGLMALVSVVIDRDAAALYLAAVALVVSFVPTFTLLVAEGWSNERMVFAVEDTKLEDQLADDGGSSVKGVRTTANPRFYGFEPNVLQFVVPATGQLVGPGGGTRSYPALLLITAVTLLAALTLRQSVAARLVFAAGLLVLLGVIPYTGWVLGLFLTPLHLWRIPWMFPFGIAVAFTLERFLHLLTVQRDDGLLARLAEPGLRRLGLPALRLPPLRWDHPALRAVAAFLGAAAVGYLAPAAVAATPLADSPYPALVVMGEQIDRTLSGEALFVGGQYNNFIPSISPRAKVVMYRNENLMQNYGLTAAEAQARNLAWQQMVAEETPYPDRTRLLAEYGVSYLMLDAASPVAVELLGAHGDRFEMVAIEQNLVLIRFMPTGE